MFSERHLPPYFQYYLLYRWTFILACHRFVIDHSNGFTGTEVDAAVTKHTIALRYQFSSDQPEIAHGTAAGAQAAGRTGIPHPHVIPGIILGGGEIPPLHIADFAGQGAEAPVFFPVPLQPAADAFHPRRRPARLPAWASHLLYKFLQLAVCYYSTACGPCKYLKPLCSLPVLPVLQSLLHRLLPVLPASCGLLPRLPASVHA